MEKEKAEDLIFRKAAIDALIEHRALYCDNTPDTFSKLSYAEKSRVDELDTAIATLVNMPSADVREVINSAWIPVSERLPSNGDIVICTEHFPQMDYVRMVYYRHGRFNTSPNPNDICNEDLTDNITAWMPLPTPYKEQ